MKLFIFALAIFLCHMAAGRPFFSDFFLEDFFVDVRDCHGIRCPEGTSACVKNQTTTDDLKTVYTHIICQDEKGRELFSDVKTEANPNGNTVVHSFSYRGSFGRSSSSKGTNLNVGVNTNTGDSDKHEYDAVETFE